MREIKFRYWDKESKQFIPNKYWAVYRNKQNSLIIVIKPHNDLGWELGEFGYENIGALEQYTGLKDKNGKEIYEGDTVKYTNPHKYYVVISNIIYVEQSGRFHANGTTCENLFEFITDINGKNYSEIIGNIHENPELV